MATLIRRMYQGYRYINEELADPRTQDFFLIGSPWPLLALLGLYLYFVQDWGPSFMAKRKPFKLEKLIQIYNGMQIAICAYVFYKALVLAWIRDYKFVCEPVDYSYAPKPLEIARMVWTYFMLKAFDLLDTIFFVLRKKQNQISFLHVYHHTGMVFGTWAATKFLPGGHVTFLGVINCFVHIIMYTHYLVTSMGISRPWWKKYITQLQLTQFFIIMVQYVLLVMSSECDFPRWVGIVLIPQNFFMIVLFSDFYYKAYIKKTEKKVVRNGVTPEVSNGKLKNQ